MNSSEKHELPSLQSKKKSNQLRRQININCDAQRLIFQQGALHIEGRKFIMNFKYVTGKMWRID